MDKSNRPVNLVVAIDRQGVLGSTTHLGMLWHVPADLRHFKEVTMGGSMIMGYRTYESIGRALPGRQSIVLSRHNRPVADGVELVHSPAEALSRAKSPVYIIGGGQIFDLYKSQATHLYVTEIDTDSGGDIVFTIDLSKWKEVSRTAHDADTQNPHGYTFVEYERKR